MKVKTSVTLSEELLGAIDKHSKEFKSRSEFLEEAARGFLLRLARTKAEKKDLEIINRHADELNAEAQDVLSFQAPL